MGFSRYVNRFEPECHGFELEIEEAWVEEGGQVLLRPQCSKQWFVVNSEDEVRVA